MLLDRQQIERILEHLGCSLVPGGDDGSGFIWEVPGASSEYYFDYEAVTAKVVVEQLANAGLVEPSDIPDPDAFVAGLLA